MKLKDYIEKIDVKKTFTDRKLALDIAIQDISAYRISGKLKTESIDLYEEEKIIKILDYIKKYADESISPQGLFEVGGIPYDSTFVVFEDAIRGKTTSHSFKNNALSELKEILGKSTFSIPDKDIIDIVISIPLSRNEYYRI